MSFRNLTPLAGISMLYAQSGSVLLTMANLDVTGHAQGYDGSGTQSYVEVLCGAECGTYTAADNTTGTKFFPDIKYFITIKNYGISGSGTLQTECIAQSVTGDNLSKDNTYNPSVSPSVHFRIYHGTEIFGKFNRFAIYKTAFTADKARILLTKGPSIN